MLGGIRSGKSQWAETAVTRIDRHRAAGALPGHRRGAGRRRCLVGAGGRTPGSPATALVDDRNRRRANPIAVRHRHRHTGRRPGRLADRDDGPPRRLDRRLGGRRCGRPDRRGRRLRLRAGAGQPRGGADGGAADGRPVAGSPTSWACSISDWPRCATGWCWWLPASRSALKERLVTVFPPIAAPDAAGGRRSAHPAGHVDQAARCAGPARGSVGVGGVVPGRLPAAAVSARAGGGVRRRSRCRRRRGVGVSAGGHRPDGRQLRRGRRGDQRAGRGGRRQRAGGRHRGGHRRAAARRRSARTRCAAAAEISPSRTR